MTCRIDRLTTEDDGVILRISGRCVGASLDVLRDALAEGHGVRTIDLKAISKARGIALKNCPGFVQEWIARETAEPDSHLPSDGRDR